MAEHRADVFLDPADDPREGGPTLGDERTTLVDTGLVIDELAARGLRHVLCEGGPRLFSELLAADRVDELCLTLAPIVAGGGHRRLTADQPLEPQRFALVRLLEADDGYLLARYLRR